MDKSKNGNPIAAPRNRMIANEGFPVTPALHSSPGVIGVGQTWDNKPSSANEKPSRASSIFPWLPIVTRDAMPCASAYPMSSST